MPDDSGDYRFTFRGFRLHGTPFTRDGGGPDIGGTDFTMMANGQPYRFAISLQPGEWHRHEKAGPAAG